MYRKLVVTSLIGASLVIPTLAVAQNDEWKQKMEDAQEAKDDLMDAVGAKSGPKAVEATAKMAKILQEAKEYWAGLKMADVVKLADANLAALDAMSKLAGSGKMDQSKAAFDKIGDSCSVCHDVQPEMRLTK
jgi:soluble cytochrome b562